MSFASTLAMLLGATSLDPLSSQQFRCSYVFVIIYTLKENLTFADTAHLACARKSSMAHEEGAFRSELPYLRLNKQVS